MTIATVRPAELTGNIKAISSKSDLHRAIIAASLCETPVKIYCNTLSADIVATVACLNSLAANIEASQVQGGYVISVATGHKAPKEPICNCNESGTTLRLLTPVAAAKYSHVTFEGQGRLAQRPMEPLLSCMREHGVSFSRDTLPFTIKGHLKPGTYKIAGDVSSQFISGLLFALPLLKKRSKILLTTKLESAPYVNMTTATLNNFGVKVDSVPAGFSIEGGQRYISPKEIYAEGDWSNAAFWLCAGAICGDVTVEGLKFPNTNQGDVVILKLLRNFGAEIYHTTKNKLTDITVKKSKLTGIAIDLSQCPDLAPILAVVGAAAEGSTILTGGGRLKLKESDRLLTTAELINSLGGEAKVHNDTIVVKGGGLKGGTVNSYNDHRIAMAAAIAGCFASGPVVIEDAKAVEKSYPNFYNDLTKLGGSVDVL